MSHEVFGNRFYSNRIPAWHNLGIVLPTPLTAEEAWSTIGPYDVQLEPVTLMSDPSIHTKYHAIVRSATPDDNTDRIFGIVSDDYILIPPDEIVSLWDDATALTLETMGSLKGGRTLFLSTYLSSSDINGDELKNYLLLNAPFNGQDAIEVIVTKVRTVCQNTLMAARRQSTEFYRIPHTTNCRQNLQNWLTGISSRAQRRLTLLQQAFVEMANTPLSSFSDVDILLNNIYPSPRPVDDTLPEPALSLRQQEFTSLSRLAIRSREAVARLFDGEGTAITPTMYGLYNAVVEWEDYKPGYDPALQAYSALFGDRASAKERAYAILSR